MLRVFTGIASHSTAQDDIPEALGAAHQVHVCGFSDPEIERPTRDHYRPKTVVKWTTHPRPLFSDKQTCTRQGGTSRLAVRCSALAAAKPHRWAAPGKTISYR